MLTIEYQKVEEQCAHCARTHDVVRGPVLHDGKGVGLYLAGLHTCSGEPLAVLTISLAWEPEPITFTIQAWATEAQNEMVFVDSDSSPWASEGYLGTLLSAQEARESELRETVFQVADLICGTVPEVRSYLDAMLDA